MAGWNCRLAPSSPIMLLVMRDSAPPGGRVGEEENIGCLIHSMVAEKQQLYFEKCQPFLPGLFQTRENTVGLWSRMAGLSRGFIFSLQSEEKPGLSHSGAAGPLRCRFFSPRGRAVPGLLPVGKGVEKRGSPSCCSPPPGTPPQFFRGTFPYQGGGCLFPLPSR